MSTKAQRVYEARRAGLVARLTDEGLRRADAERLVDEWRTEADVRGIDRVQSAYWRGAAVWAHERA